MLYEYLTLSPSQAREVWQSFSLLLATILLSHINISSQDKLDCVLFVTSETVPYFHKSSLQLKHQSASVSIHLPPPVTITESHYAPTSPPSSSPFASPRPSSSPSFSSLSSNLSPPSSPHSSSSSSSSPSPPFVPVSPTILARDYQSFIVPFNLHFYIPSKYFNSPVFSSVLKTQMIAIYLRCFPIATNSYSQKTSSDSSGPSCSSNSHPGLPDSKNYKIKFN